jgi:hypothetical protein
VGVGGTVGVGMTVGVDASVGVGAIPSVGFKARVVARIKLPVTELEVTGILAIGEDCPPQPVSIKLDINKHTNNSAAESFFLGLNFGFFPFKSSDFVMLPTEVQISNKIFLLYSQK